MYIIKNLGCIIKYSGKLLTKVSKYKNWDETPSNTLVLRQINDTAFEDVLHYSLDEEDFNDSSVTMYQPLESISDNKEITNLVAIDFYTEWERYFEYIFAYRDIEDLHKLICSFARELGVNSISYIDSDLMAEVVVRVDNPI
ncbi:hypothetical protein ACI2JA_03150 [Alkalihalobacillus sp. NPDC078783]